MKKIIGSLVFTVFLLSNLNAQVVQGTSNVGNGGGSSGDIMFGAKAGFSASTFIGGEYPSLSMKPGFYVGGVAEIPAFLENFYLQPEIVFQLQGTGDISTGDALNLLYVHIPIMGKYHITDQIAVEFGPQIGFLMADNWPNEVSGFDTNKIHVGLNIGGGYRMDENFYFQLRVSPGLTRVLDNANTKSRNLAFQLGASYFF